MGLIGGILAPLFMGTPVTLLSPLAFVQRPRRWLEAISRYQATGSAGPNFAYDHCVRKVRPEFLDRIDLSSWRVAFNGAEPVRARTLQEFSERFAPCGFRADAMKPCYGLAESTLLVSASRTPSVARVRRVEASSLERGRIVAAPDADAGGRALVGCGTPRSSVVIVDPVSRRRCGRDEVGEIWISGPSVAREYWNRPDESRATFGALLQDSGEEPFLRTGDLGFLADGELFVTGRLKDLIIVDGANHYPQDIEHTASGSHAALEPDACAAFSVEVAGKEELVVVAGIRSAASLAASEIGRAVRSAVSRDHHLRVHELVLVKRGGLPVTSSGKIQRNACRAGYLAGTLEGWGTR
jgi:acyl-CoA synthetase (AMP-forming)/AMP-acid ligase II